MQIPVLCMVSDIHLFALKPFALQFQKYWGGYVKTQVIVAGYSRPGFELPTNFKFVSLGDFRDYPASRYSDSLILALTYIQESHFILMLEDFWLTRPVNYLAIGQLANLCKTPGFADVLRLDLTADRMYAGHPVQELGSYGFVDLIATPAPSPYRMSFQAGIFNKKLLLDLLIPGETPWEIELHGTKRLAQAPVRVIGTRQPPIRYFIGIQAGKVNWQDGNNPSTPPWQVPVTLLSPEDKREIQALMPYEKL